MSEPTPDAAAALDAIRARIAAAARAAARAVDEVTLVAVSKTFAAEAIRPVLAAGQRVFGENRVQEAEAKWPALRGDYPDTELHLIGKLQSNKAREAVALFDVIESVDRDKLAGVLAEAHHVGTPAQAVVVGVGINVRDVPYVSERERATSLERELGALPDAGAVLVEVLAAWSARYQDLLDGRFTRIVERWRIRATGLAGRPVAWVDARGEHEGTTTGVDATGALLVDTGHGVVRITSGAVQWQ